MDGVLFNRSKTTLWQYPAKKSGKDYVIPAGVTSIEDEAFYSCASLESVIIPDSVTSIGGGAFCACTALTSIAIPAGVKTIWGGAFSGCSALASINVAANNSVYRSVDGVLFNKNKTTLLLYPAGKSNTDYTIPNGVTSIGEWAFGDCPALTSITLSANVTDIRSYAFVGCSELTSLTVPASVMNIEDHAFDNCDKLADVYYGGTEPQWDGISIDFYNSCLWDAFVHYNSVPAGRA